jgi:hypothetical protein
MRRHFKVSTSPFVVLPIPDTKDLLALVHP